MTSGKHSGSHSRSVSSDSRRDVQKRPYTQVTDGYKITWSIYI